MTRGKPEPVGTRLSARLVREGECLVWTGAVANGYGRIGTGSRSTAMVHRVAYELAYGPIPEGLHIDHLCRNRLCCRPEHLEAVTQAENNRRMWEANKATHCKRGHAFTPENTMYRRLEHYRMCRACKNAGARALRARRRVRDDAGNLATERNNG